MMLYIVCMIVSELEEHMPADKFDPYRSVVYLQEWLNVMLY